MLRVDVFNRMVQIIKYTEQQNNHPIRIIAIGDFGQLAPVCIAEDKEALEKEYPGSISLSAGSCSLCKDGCTRAVREPCRYPEMMRYSIESLGGDVGRTVSKLMGYELEWIEEGKLPSYFVLVGGLLKK